MGAEAVVNDGEIRDPGLSYRDDDQHEMSCVQRVHEVRRDPVERLSPVHRPPFGRCEPVREGRRCVVALQFEL